MKYLRNSKLLFYITLAMNLSLFAPIEVIYLKSLGLPLSIISLLNLTVPVTCALMEIPTGILGDYIGRKKILLLSQFSFLASMILLLVANNYFIVFLAYILEGLAWSFFSGNTDAIVVEESLNEKMDIGKQFALVYSGFSLAPVIAGILNAYFSGQGWVSMGSANLRIFIVVTALIRATAVFTVFLVKVNTKDTHGSLERKLTPVQLSIEAIRLIKSSAFNVSVIIYEAFGRLSFYIPVIVQPLLIKYGVGLVYFGLIFTATQAITFLVQYRVDAIVKRLGIKRTLKYSNIALAFGLLLLLIPDKIPVILCLIIIQTVGTVRNQCLTLKKNESVENTIRATYLSTISFCVLIVNAALLSGIGFILDKLFIAGILILAFICAGGGIVYKNIVEGSKGPGNNNKDLRGAANESL